MKQQLFESQHSALWQKLENTIADGSAGKSDDFPADYRLLCQHLAVAKSRNYTTQLTNRLNRLVVAAHTLFYSQNRLSRQGFVWFIVHGFPGVIRRNSRLVLWAWLWFLVPLFGFGLSAYFNTEVIYTIQSPETVRSYESMYDPENRVLGSGRDSEDDIYMFGHYISNNISVGFRTFAAGVVFALGSIFFLVFNGLHIGAVAGHLTQLGYNNTFWGFVCGHAAFELTAIVFCGAAGIKLGLAIIDPGPWKRIDAVRIAGREAILIVYGAALMLVLAAFVEAFWSSNGELPMTIKLTVGATFAVLVTLYFVCLGRAREPR